MKVCKEQITSLIPHRAPFLMIDNLLEAASDKFVTDFRVLPENIFVEGQVLRESALIENIAQTAAAGIAFVNRSSRSGPAIGFMGGISKLVVHDLPKVSDTILTVVTKTLQLDHMYLLRGESYVEGRKLMECEIKLAEGSRVLPGGV